ncbi:MAG: Rne/Rng family ribonuclease [Bacteroidota bacterium]
MKKQIIISSSLSEVRIAITENDQLAELLVESPDKERYVGSVYTGKVRNIVQGMNAAFVDIGLDQDAFLHFSDVAESLEDNFIVDEDDEDEDEKPKQQQKPQRNQQQRNQPRAPQQQQNQPPQNPFEQADQRENVGEENSSQDSPRNEAAQDFQNGENQPAPQNEQRQQRPGRNDRGGRNNNRRNSPRNQRPQENQEQNAQEQGFQNRDEAFKNEPQQDNFKAETQHEDTFKTDSDNSQAYNPTHHDFFEDEPVHLVGEDNLPQEGFIENLLENTPDSHNEAGESAPQWDNQEKKRGGNRRPPRTQKAAPRNPAPRNKKPNNLGTPEEPFRTESFAMHNPDSEVFKENFPNDNSGNSPDANFSEGNPGEGNAEGGDRNKRYNRNNRRGGRGRGGRGRRDNQPNDGQPQEFSGENPQPDFDNNRENRERDGFKNDEFPPFKNEENRDFNNDELPPFKGDEQRPVDGNEEGFKNNQARPHNAKPPRGPRPERKPHNPKPPRSEAKKPEQTQEQQPRPEQKKQEPKHQERRPNPNRKFEPRNDQNAKRYPTFQTKRSGLVTINLEKDQDIVVQVVREAYHAKGVRVSTNVSFPGRYVVFMPFEQGMGVSRKITSFKERKRLRSLAKSILPEGSGCIIRTAAEGKSEEELQRDMTYLRDQWLEIDRKIKASTGPGPVYRDMSLASSAMRDLFTTDVERVLVDSKKMYKEITEYLQFTSPALVSKVELYEGREHVFDATGVSKDIQTMYQRKVNLQSGGSIVIDPTEALVAIDVNSGRASGGSDQEANNVRLNFEAAREVARQIRLRDIGGMIIVDFIDMNDERNRLKIYHEMRKQLSFDRAKTVAYPITQLGLLQITRQRVHQNITEKMTEICPLCTGTGRVQSRSEVIHAIERWLKSFRGQSRDFRLTLAVHPAIATYLTEGVLPKLTRLMLKYFLKVQVQPDDKLHMHEFRFFGKDGKDITKNF